MQKYTQQLLIQIEQIILKRWRERIPHYYEAGMRNKYLEPPKGWKEEDTQKNDLPEMVVFENSMEEIETWLEGKAEFSMFYHFDLEPNQFPPPERLTDAQLDDLVFALHRLWNTFNFTASLPEDAPSRMVYPILLKQMLELATVMNFGHSGIEFCDYEPENCVFKEYCTCTEFLEEAENMSQDTIQIPKPVEERKANLDSNWKELNSLSDFDETDDLQF